MDQESARAVPDPGDDLEFSSCQITWRKSDRGLTTGTWNEHVGGQQSWFQVRLWEILLVLLALWAGLLFDPVVGPLLLIILICLGMTLAVIVGTMALGFIGRGLFVAGDHVIAWLRQGTQWPEQ